MAEQSNEAKSGGPTTSRQGLYAVAHKYTKEAIETLAELMRQTRNPAVRMGAARALLDKALPDLKATEISGIDGADLQLVIKIIDDKPHDTNRTGDQKLSETAGDIQQQSPVQDSTEGQTVRTD